MKTKSYYLYYYSLVLILLGSLTLQAQESTDSLPFFMMPRAIAAPAEPDDPDGGGNYSTWYRDYDRDGWGNQYETMRASSKPYGYLATYGDCDDRDASITNKRYWYRDADGDGYGSKVNSIFAGCNVVPSGYVSNNNDYDDSTKNITNIPPRYWYRDADGDGYGNPSVKVYYSKLPSGYVSNNQDCNDSNASIKPTTKWYRDADGDGYGKLTEYKIQCTQPSGYVRNYEDCNDTNKAIKPTTRWYRDADGDGYGNSSNYKTQCVQPSGYVLTGGDYNDSTKNITNIAPRYFYRDADGDGYGNPSVKVYYSNQPSGYVTNNQDCNDSNAALKPTTQWYQDADGDGYGNPSSYKTQCAQPSGYVLNNQDCNDSNASIKPTTKWYQDADGDGYGNPSSYKTQCAQPSGYVLNNQDCNDSNASLKPTTRWYQDADGDGYGNPNSSKTQCAQPSGYVLNNQDCNDSNASIKPTTKWYQDADGDGYGNPSNYKTQCAQPSGYVSNNQDCNDSNVALKPTTQWYQDADGDGYGNPSSYKTQCTQPSGYVSNNQDCNDNNASINPTTIWYQDTDGDGYGNPNSSKAQCTKPTGYVSNNSDCNDSNASINPTTKWYQDSDEDGKGDPNSSKIQCTQPTGYVRNANDQCPALAGNQANGCPPGMTPVSLSDRNYIYVQEPLEAVTSVSTSTKKVHNIQYFDGLGRPMQSIGIGASPLGKDVITPIVYDEFGRQVKDYLPYAGSQNTGAYVDNTTAITGVETYYSTHYDDTTPFSQKELEASPLSRVLKQAAPGEAWKMGSGHEIEFRYQTNTATEVKRFDAITDGSYVPNLQANGYYAAGQLYKTVTKDENHSNGSAHTIEEFKDKEGKVVLKRTYGEAGSSATATAHDTYYVYDTYGNLTYVLPPKMKGSTANLAELGYQYRYDERNRLIEKQLPGKAREYMVYDTQDRLVATQDGVQRAQGAWLFTKYDQFGRVLYTGTTNGGTNRATVQSAVTAKGKNNETSGSFTHSGISVPYTNSTGYPTSITELFTVNVYDAYPSDAPSAPSSVEGQAIANTSTTPNLKGLATASYVKVQGTSTWTKTYTYYDLKARPVRSYSRNHLGGYTISDHKLDFRGKPEYTKTQHKRTNSDSEQTTITYFTYDHAERLVKTEQQDTGNGAKITLAGNSYDELGQLTSKKVGNNLQTVDYDYNIRGWLTHINDISQQGSDLFAFKINYNELESSGVSNVQGLYNGNISETFWKTTDNVKRGYVYKYDALNRLKAGYYLKNSGAPGYFNVENITYDENGNILGLKRNGTSDTSVVLMDQLSYTYDQGNRLTKVDDTSNNTNGFKDGVKQTTEYTYDVNGNMTEDQNKGITGIKYNYLNLPTQITFANGNKIEYLYDAAGIKLQKKVFEGSTTTVTEYLDGYQYVDGKLEFYPHAEGYVKVKEDNTLQYVYHYTDHLGNVRLSYTKGSDGKAQVVEESNYYPFGLKHKGYNNNSNTLTDKYKYGYQGQELQDELGLGWSSFKWRNADPALGRFMSIDPLAEDYVYNSTYAFQENKLGMGRELEGLELCVGCGFMTEYAVEALQEAGFNRAAGALQSYSSTPGSFLYDPLQSSIDFVGAVADGEYTTAGKMLDPIGVSSLPDVVRTADTAINGEGASQELAQGQLLGATPGVVGGLMTGGNALKGKGNSKGSGGNINWPANDGFSGTPKPITLEVGVVIDRYGAGTGKYASPQGTPLPQRSLPLGSENRPLNTYKIVKPINEVQSGKVAPWFDQPGGGTQYKLPQSVDDLLKSGHLEQINP